MIANIVTPMRVFILLKVIFLASILGVTLGAQAYPVILDADALADFMGLPKDHLLAFAPSLGGGSAQQPGIPKEKWRRIALQTDELEDGSLLILRQPDRVFPARKTLEFPGQKDPFRGLLNRVHRVILDESEFAPQCGDACEKEAALEAQKLCGGSLMTSVLKIKVISTQTSGFLTACSSPVSKQVAVSVQIDTAKKVIGSDVYKYVFKTEKNILPEHIQFVGQGNPAVTDSELQVYLNHKFLPKVHLTEDKTQSFITSVTNGPLSAAAELGFVTRIMGIKVGSQVCCDMSFFKDAFYLPVVLDLPFSGSSFQTGSGVFFGFKFGPDTEIVSPQHPSTELGNKQNVLLIKQGKHAIAIGVRTAKTKPQFLAGSDLKAMQFPKTNQTSGVFYDVTKLNKGFHNFTIWFFAGPVEIAPRLVEFASYGVAYEAKYL